MADHPYSDCELYAKNGMPCSQPARFVVDGQDTLVCYGHSKSKDVAGYTLSELPEMYATLCHSGDTWVTCPAHRSSYALFSSKSPKLIHTDIECETCSTLDDMREEW